MLGRTGNSRSPTRDRALHLRDDHPCFAHPTAFDFPDNPHLDIHVSHNFRQRPLEQLHIRRGPLLVRNYAEQEFVNPSLHNLSLLGAEGRVEYPINEHGMPAILCYDLIVEPSPDLLYKRERAPTRARRLALGQLPDISNFIADQGHRRIQEPRGHHLPRASWSHLVAVFVQEFKLAHVRPQVQPPAGALTCATNRLSLPVRFLHGAGEGLFDRLPLKREERLRIGDHGLHWQALAYALGLTSEKIQAARIADQILQPVL